MSDDDITISQRVSAEGHPFSEIRITSRGRRYLSRVPYVVGDSPYARAEAFNAFRERQRREIAS